MQIKVLQAGAQYLRLFFLFLPTPHFYRHQHHNHHLIQINTVSAERGAHSLPSSQHR